MATLAENLEYLRLNAFQFHLEINPHASYHEPIDEHLDTGRDSGDCDDDWISREQREEAYRTGHFVDGRVYPNGSVSFYTSRGTNIEAIVAALAECCRNDQARYTKAGYVIKDGPAFQPREIPA